MSFLDEIRIKCTLYFHLYCKPRCFWRNLHCWQKILHCRRQWGMDKSHLWEHTLQTKCISIELKNFKCASNAKGVRTLSSPMICLFWTISQPDLHTPGISNWKKANFAFLLRHWIAWDDNWLKLSLQHICFESFQHSDNVNKNFPIIGFCWQDLESAHSTVSLVHLLL